MQQYLSQFEQLVKENLPKLGDHFLREMINPSMYASQWFITVFSYSFPFHLALRIWDVFLYEVSYPNVSVFMFFHILFLVEKDSDFGFFHFLFLVEKNSDFANGT